MKKSWNELLAIANRAINLIAKVLASNRFFYLILLIVTLQGLWYALSFQLAMYDEPTHFRSIQMYAQGESPFATHQDPKWDTLGETTRSPNYLFYYLMSLILRLFSLFLHSTSAQIIALRIVCIALFAAGIFYYKKTFSLAKVPPALVNIVLLFFVITPGVAILPGVISYDNAVIFLTAILFYLTARVLIASKLNIRYLWGIATVGLLGSIVKFTFLAIFAPISVILFVYLYKKYGRHLWVTILHAYKSLGTTVKVALVATLLISSSLFIERVGINFVRYHSDTPACTQIMSLERCTKNDITKRNLQNEKSAKAHHFNPVNIYDYVLAYWLPHMVYHQASPTKVLPVMGLFYMTFAFGGLVVALLYLRGILRNKVLLALTIVAVIYCCAVLFQNYQAYLDQGIPVATNGRYLFPILPVFCLLVGLALVKVSGRFAKIILVPSFLVSLILMTQGGGIITYILDNYEPIFWQNNVVLTSNEKAKEILSPLVRGG